jgi:F0F1-type ATP synthase assembly protein I
MSPTPQDHSGDRTRQAKAWVIALDPLYGMIGFGVIGYGIDWLRGTEGLQWAIYLGILGLVVGFYRFIREAMTLNKQQTRSSSRTDGDPGT